MRCQVVVGLHLFAGLHQLQYHMFCPVPACPPIAIKCHQQGIHAVPTPNLFPYLIAIVSHSTHGEGSGIVVAAQGTCLHVSHEVLIILRIVITTFSMSTLRKFLR